MKKKDILDKSLINNKHISLFNTALESVETLLNRFYKAIENCDENPLELSKNLIATLDFLISAIVKIQKAQRLALNLDNDIQDTNTVPQINFIEGINYQKI